MLDEKLQSKIDLLQEQIESFEKSGFHTEAEIDMLTCALKYELRLLQNSLALEFLTITEIIELQSKVNDAICMRMRLGNQITQPLKNIGKTIKESLSPDTSDKSEFEAYGMSPESYLEGKKMHNYYFNRNDINVVDAEILTPNNSQA